MTQNIYCWAVGVGLGKAGSVEGNKISSIFFSHSEEKNTLTTSIAIMGICLEEEKKNIDLKKNVELK